MEIALADCVAVTSLGGPVSPFSQKSSGRPWKRSLWETDVTVIAAPSFFFIFPVFEGSSQAGSAMQTRFAVRLRGRVFYGSSSARARSGLPASSFRRRD